MYETSTPILVDDIRQFLLDLREKHHHIFAMLSYIPVDTFRIIADDAVHPCTNRMNIEMFFKDPDRFHPKYTFFTVKYRTYLFRKDWSEIKVDMEQYDIPFRGEMQAACISPEQLDEVVENFEGILAYNMRDLLFRGTVFNLHPVVCHAFGLTPEDVEVLRPMASRCLAGLLKEITADRLRLQKILTEIEKDPPYGLDL